MNYLSSIAKTWNSINPATLSGAIDVIVIEDDKGNFNCSPFHIRFGKFQLLRPSHKKVNFTVNGELTDIQMKLGDGGEAFFVFEASDSVDGISDDMMTSPVVSAASSALSSPLSSPKSEPETLEEPDYLDLGPSEDRPSRNSFSGGSPFTIHKSRTMSSIRSLSPQRAKKLSKQLTMKNIPTKIDSNGDLVLDVSGYKASEQDIKNHDKIIKDLLKDEFGEEFNLNDILTYDENSKMYPESPNSLLGPDNGSTSSLSLPSSTSSDNLDLDSPSKYSGGPSFIKTLRLTSDQLKCLNLKYGENTTEFNVDGTKSSIKSRIFLWKYDVPVVISDIDGTITKSDALGHVFTMIGKDWTHEGVAKLFSDIKTNGYNIMYLTARSVGLADTTRAYLNGIDQEGFKIPAGPVILSPDRTMAALRREVILKKPEVFKITCLTDLRNLYGNVNKSPFYAGFGNRITDALSYRSVDIPSSKIFTINTDGDVHMEFLELAGYKSSYIHINELVDHFFPPVIIKNDDRKDGINVFTDEKFTDAVFWREPIIELTDDEDEDEVLQNSAKGNSTTTEHNADNNDLIKDGNTMNEVADENMMKIIAEKGDSVMGHDSSNKDSHQGLGLINASGDHNNYVEEALAEYNHSDIKNELDEYNTNFDDLDYNYNYDEDEDEDEEEEEDDDDEEEELNSQDYDYEGEYGEESLDPTVDNVEEEDFDREGEIMNQKFEEDTFEEQQRKYNELKSLETKNKSHESIIKQMEKMDLNQNNDL